jgi:hypothetical protein
MSVTDVRLNSTGLPVGTWVVDPVHSFAGFALNLDPPMGWVETREIGDGGRDGGAAVVIGW